VTLRGHLTPRRLLVQNGFWATSARKDFWCRMVTFGADRTFSTAPYAGVLEKGPRLVIVLEDAPSPGRWHHACGGKG
jgi:hypothetical protein